MTERLLISLVLASLISGCSKKEETSPPTTAPQTAANAEMKAPAVDSLTTNIRPAVTSAPSGAAVSAENAAAVATNAVQIPAATTNPVTVSAPGGGDRAPAPNTAATLASAAPAPAQPAAPLSLAGLSSDQVTRGIKEALGKGLQHAVSTLGQPGGFLTNLNVKIPLPEKLQTVEKGLRAIGQGKYADQCITTMNQAAEQAVPAAADVFANSLQNMSVEDAKGLLSGPPDAATQFFRKSTEAELTKRFAPIVQQAMAKCGTTAAYEQVLDKAKIVSPFFSNPSLDLNAYVTGKTMDGLFTMVADEEKRIRENPIARSSDLLKSVFGAVQK